MAEEGKLGLLNRAGCAWLLALLWTAVVLSAGGDHASADSTSRFLGPLLQWLLPAAAPETLARIHFLIRKGAHVGEYGLLAILALRALRASRPSTPAAGALLWVALVAGIDEARQALALAREGSAWDFALDLTGGALALAALALYTRHVSGEPATREVE